MSDNLRDRIAAVLFSHNAGDDWNMEPLLWEEISESYRECWLKQADAVIAELNLATACESGCVWQIPNRFRDMTPRQRELLKRSES